MFTKSNKARFGAVITGALMLGATFGANAMPIVELALVVDSSGSINDSEWTAQVQGYSSALGALLPIDGSVAVSVIRFATDSTIIRNMTTISNAADRTALADFFWTTTTQLSQDGNDNLTCISCGIFAGESTFSGNATKSIIDVSTDGFWNVGVDPDGAAAIVGTSEWAVANKATVLNAIGIGVVPNFAYGPGSFALVALDFNSFEAAISFKIATEINQGPGPGGDPETDPDPTTDIPEPGTLALFGLGLVGLGIARRRKVA